jgi:hypothetical protein
MRMKALGANGDCATATGRRTKGTTKPITGAAEGGADEGAALESCDERFSAMVDPLSAARWMATRMR